MFKNYYTPIRNAYITVAVISFGQNKRSGETPEQHWKKLCEIEKECEFKDITPGELMVSKFITSITDTKLRDKILDDGDMSVKTVMNRIKQDTYDKKHGKNFLTRSRSEKRKRNTKSRKISTETK